MIVIADTSPLNYLVLIEQSELLPRLYGTLVIPPAVHREMLDRRAPSAVRNWAGALPGWLEVREAGPEVLPFHPKLNAGEREAITLAYGNSGSLLLMDEALGRQQARQFGVNVTGTLGILVLAHRRGFVDLPTAVAKLRETSFQASRPLIQSVLNSVSDN